MNIKLPFWAKYPGIYQDHHSKSEIRFFSVESRKHETYRFMLRDQDVEFLAI